MKVLSLAVCLLFCFHSNAQNRFVLNGMLSGTASKWIYLQYENEVAEEVRDSTIVQNGFFSFSGRIDQPTRAILKLNRQVIPDDENLNILQIILAPGEVGIKVKYNDFQHGIVTGSKPHDEFKQLRKSAQPFVDKYLLLRDSLSKMERPKPESTTNKVAIADLNQRINNAIAGMRKTSFNFIQDHPGSWVSAFELNNLKTTSFTTSSGAITSNLLE
ncbi:protein of unknown function [Dyadobacter soli]|uniref:DUF4369 domain-containing protein n=1 Tax=Dyadobacter soli TaxID=659014 RepID=A0A1G7NDN4_9BACT|nr:DUF4369 domain-containing protein [Dyadobacter soli]SDF72066.1 protein of unknown function [Dyadobacter soli]